MPTITAKVSDELLAYIDLVSGGNRSEYLRRCLEAVSEIYSRER